MSNTITVTFEIEAPELAGAINNFAQALDRYVAAAISSAYNQANYNNSVYMSGSSVMAPTGNQQIPENSVSMPPQQYSASVVPSAKPETSSYTYQMAPTASPAMPMQTYSQQPMADQNSQPVPPPSHSFSFDDIARAAWSLVEGGKQIHFIELLRKFGIQALTQLPKEQFVAFALALRQLGVGI